MRFDSPSSILIPLLFCSYSMCSSLKGMRTWHNGGRTFFLLLLLFLSLFLFWQFAILNFLVFLARGRRDVTHLCT